MLRLSGVVPRTWGSGFCDGCAEVTTAEQRARRRYDRSRADVYR